MGMRAYAHLYGENSTPDGSFEMRLSVFVLVSTMIRDDGMNIPLVSSFAMPL
jgi:hypothetical protein